MEEITKEEVAKILYEFYFAVMDELVKEDSKRYFEFFNKAESKAAKQIIAKFSARG
jgi:predicted nucleic acid-binding OB-fold protein